MADYQVTCTIQQPMGAAHTDAHIVTIGSNGLRWTVAQAYQYIDAGHRFYTVSPSTGRTAFVRKFQCRSCYTPTLKSDPDAIRDNNLDSLPRCS